MTKSNKNNMVNTFENQATLTDRLLAVGLTQKRLRGYYKKSKQQIWDALQPETRQTGLRKKIEALIEKKENEI